jgi:peptide/nickel transport system permease protein
VFQWPGLGILVIQSIQFADVPLLASYLVLIAFGFAIINLAVDLLYAAVDPRVRAGMAVSRVVT